MSVLKNSLKCHCVELQDVRDMTVEELFGGYDTLQAITFSFGIDMVEQIAGLFSNAEIVVGAAFSVRKNMAMHDALFQAFADGMLTTELVGKYMNITAMMQSGTLRFRATLNCIDHRKIYILSADDGRHRVVVTSANMSPKAWSEDQLEVYTYDDSDYAYDAYMYLFNTAWDMAIDVPYEVAPVDEDDIVSGNVVVKNIINANNMVIVPAQEDSVTREIVQYIVRRDELADEYAGLFKDVLKGKGVIRDGFYQITAGGIEKLKTSYKKIQAQRNVKLAIDERPYPKMLFVYDKSAPAMYLGEKEQDLSPDSDAVRSDIENLLAIFRHFDDDGEFIGDLENLRRNHYKFLIYMLMAPHVAKLRCEAYFYNITETSLPLFVILTSRQPDAGKTFMVEAVMRLLTGLRINGEKGEGEKFVERVRKVQAYVKSTPYLFDEVSKASFSHSVKKEVKNADFCELNGRDQQPVIVFTSNEMDDPEDVVRKRSIHLLFDAQIRSNNIDPNSFRTQGNRLKNGFSGAFYREFTRRAMPLICDMLDDIASDKGKSGDWYPDVVELSSKVFLAILHDYGYDVPSYMTPLKWNEDYYAVKNASRSTISEMRNLYLSNPEMFEFSKDMVSIRFGNDSGNQKQLKSWYNTLPPEAKAKFYASQSGCVLTMDLAEMERLGFRSKRRFKGLDFLFGKGRRVS